MLPCLLSCSVSDSQLFTFLLLIVGSIRNRSEDKFCHGPWRDHGSKGHHIFTPRKSTTGESAGQYNAPIGPYLIICININDFFINICCCKYCILNIRCRANSCCYSCLIFFNFDSSTTRTHPL